MYFGQFMRVESWQLEIVNYLFFGLVLWAGRKIMGKEKASLFLWGSLIWTLSVENAMVIRGAYDYFAYANYYCWNGKLIAGYSGWTSTILFVPLGVCLGWFTLGLPAFIISDRLLPKSNMWVKAIIASIMMVSLDMVLDPLSVVNEWWRWTVPGYYLKGVGTENYIGWFFMLFFYAGVYERTVIERGGFAWLRPLEKLIFRRNTGDLKDENYRTLGKILYFRTVMFLPVMIVAVILCGAPVRHMGYNRYAPFNSVFPSNYDQKFPASAKPAGLGPVSVTDDDIRKIKGPRCEDCKGKSVNFSTKENNNVQK